MTKRISANIEPVRRDDTSKQTKCSERLYHNRGNTALLNLLDISLGGRALDCGCGDGANARILASMGWDITGITISKEECDSASSFCGQVFLHNLEMGLPPGISNSYSLIIFSHTLEHLSDPGNALSGSKAALASGGRIAVALPNVLTLRQRMKFLFGDFEYESSGIMDNTHLRFYTFQSGQRLLENHGFKILTATVEGSFPLHFIRRIMPKVAHSIDTLACRLLPGLFGGQLLYVAESIPPDMRESEPPAP